MLDGAQTPAQGVHVLEVRRRVLFPTTIAFYSFLFFFHTNEAFSALAKSLYNLRRRPCVCSSSSLPGCLPSHSWLWHLILRCSLHSSCTCVIIIINTTCTAPTTRMFFFFVIVRSNVANTVPLKETTLAFYCVRSGRVRWKAAGGACSNAPYLSSSLCPGLSPGAPPAPSRGPRTSWGWRWAWSCGSIRGRRASTRGE